MRARTPQCVVGLAWGSGLRGSSALSIPLQETSVNEEGPRPALEGLQLFLGEVLIHVLEVTAGCRVEGDQATLMKQKPSSTLYGWPTTRLRPDSPTIGPTEPRHPLSVGTQGTSRASGSAEG